MDDNKKKIAFIINPISGTQGKEHILKWLDEKLDKNRYMPEVIYTEWAGHAVEIASRKAKEEVFAVVAIGGDGTINEIARSLVHTKTALGIIPCGSGNGLARHLQIPMEAKKAIDIINEGLIDIIDYGKINDVPFSVPAEWDLTHLSVCNFPRPAEGGHSYIWRKPCLKV